MLILFYFWLNKKNSFAGSGEIREAAGVELVYSPAFFDLMTDVIWWAAAIIAETTELKKHTTDKVMNTVPVDVSPFTNSSRAL